MSTRPIGSKKCLLLPQTWITLVVVHALELLVDFNVSHGPWPPVGNKIRRFGANLPNSGSPLKVYRFGPTRFREGRPPTIYTRVLVCTQCILPKLFPVSMETFAKLIFYSLFSHIHAHVHCSNHPCSLQQRGNIVSIIIILSQEAKWAWPNHANGDA